MAERSFGPVVVRRRLGSELRRLRTEAGMSLEQAARGLEVSPSKLSRLENGESPPKLWDVRNLLTLYGVGDEGYRRRAERWVNEGKSQGWWYPFSEASPADLDLYVSLEAEASEIQSFCTPFLYGLLQTRSYAESLIRTTLPHLDDAAIEGLVTVRLGRQSILDIVEPPRVRVIVDESVLRRAVGDAETMREQWEHLRAVAERIDLRVRPFQAPPHLALSSPFTIFLPREEVDRVVVNLESAYHDAYFDDDAVVAQFLRSFDDLQQTTLSPTESLSLIRRAINEGPPPAMER